MAIKINITANVSNIPQIRQKLEKHLKNINIGKAGKLLPQEDLQRLQVASKSVSTLMDQFKAKDISRAKALQDVRKEIEWMKEYPALLKERAKLTQFAGNLEKQIIKESIAVGKQALAIQKERNKTLTDFIKYQNQLKTQKEIKTKVTQYQKESDALRQLVKDGKKGILSTNEMRQASESLILSLKKQEKAIQDLGGKVKGGVKARKEQEAQLKEIIKWYGAEEQARKKAFSQNVSAVIKSEIKASKQKVKALQDEIKTREKAIIQERKLSQQYEKRAIDTSFKKQQQVMSDAIQNTIKQYEKGVYTLNDFILKSRELGKEYKNVAGAGKDLKDMYNALDKAATKYWLDAEKATAVEKKAMAEAEAIAKTRRRTLLEERTIRAALNRLKRETTGGTVKKDISNQETYNRVLKNQIDLFNARKISAEEFLRITNRLIQQESRYAEISNKLSQQLHSAKQKAVNDTKKQAKENERLTSSLKNQAIGISSVNKGLKSYISNMAMIIKKFSDWILVGSIVFLPIKVFQDAIEYIREMDDALTDLNKVVELSKNQLNDMRIEAISLGKALGVSSAEIMRSMAEFGRVTKSQEEIIELSKAATVAANVTTMTADEAAKAINTTLITFKKDVSEAMALVDSFNEIQNNFRTSAEDLAQSIGKVGAAARQAGISVDELSGYTTAIVSATGVTGNIAGTALKSIISRLFRIGTEGEASAGKAEQVLHEVGVAVRDTSGQFREFDAIISDLNKKWNGLSKVTKQNIAQTVAGTYHYSRFIALLENYDIASDAISKSINSQNSAMDENEKHLQSITGRMGTLTSTIQEKFAESLSADLIKDIITWTTELVDTFGSLRNVILLVAVAIGIWKGTQITQWIVASIGALANYNIALTKTIILTQAGAKQTFSLNLAMKTLFATIKANPIGVIIALTAGLVFWLDKQEKKYKDLLEKNELRHQQMQREVKLLNDAQNYYRENHGLVESDAQVKQELISLQDRLNETYGMEARQIDLVNGKYKEQIKALDELKTEQLTKLKEELQFEEKQLPTTLTSPAFRNGFEGLVVTSTRLGYEISNLTDQTNTLGKAQKLTVDQYIKKLEEMRNILKNSDEETIYMGGQVFTSYKQRGKAIEAIEEKLEEVNKIQEKRNYLAKVEQNLIEQNAIATGEFTAKSKEAYDILKKKIDEQQSDFSGALTKAFETATGTDFARIENAIETLNSQIANGTVSWDEYSTAIENMKITLEGMGFTSDEIQSLFKFDTGLKKVELSIEEVTTAFEEANNVYDQSRENLSTLKTAYDELSNDQKLSADTTTALVTKYPQLINYLDDEAALIEQLTVLYGDESKAARGYFKDSLEASQEFYNELKEQGTNLYDGLKDDYQEDLNEYATIQQAKADLTNKLFIIETSKNMKDFLDKMQNLNGGEFKQEWIVEFQNKDQEVGKLRSALAEIEAYLNEVGKTVVFDNLTNNIDDLNDQFDELVSNLNVVAGAIEELDTGEELNAETVMSLIELYPQLADSIGNNAALLNQLKNLHGQEANAAREAYKIKLKNNNEFMKSLVSSNESYWNGLMTAYGTDLNNWKNYMARKGELSKRTAEIIGEQWNVDLDASLEQVTGLEAWASDLYDSEALSTISETGDFIKAMKLDQDINKELDRIVQNVDFSKIGFSEEYLDPEGKGAKLSEVQIEKFIKLKQAIDEVNDELEKNANLFDLASTDKERINLLNKEVELINKKKRSLEALVLALRNERTERVRDLKGFGVTFEGAGDEIKMTNIDDILAAQRDKVNKLAKSGDEDLYERENERLKKLTTLYERFLEIQRNTIPATLNEILEGSVRELEISKFIEDTELKNFEELSEQFQKRLKVIDKEIESLNRELSLTEADDYAEKTRILTAIFDATSKKGKILNGIVEELNNTEAQSEETIKAVNETREEYSDKVNENTWDLKENTKAIDENAEAKEEADKKFADDTITSFIEWYNKQIEEQIEALEELSDIESELADQRLKDNKTQIDDLDKEITLLKKRNEEIKDTQEEEEFEKEIKKQKELIANLEKERTNRVFTADAGWVWTVDTLKIKEEKENLEKIEQDFADWKREQKIKEKEEQVKDLEDENEKIVESYDDEVQALKDSLIDKSEVIDEDKEVPKSWQGLLDKLAKIDDSFYFDSLNKLRKHLDDMQKTINEEELDWSKIDEQIQDIKDSISKKSEKKTEKKSEKAETQKKSDRIDSIDYKKVLQQNSMFREIMVENSQKWWQASTDEEREVYARANEELGTKMGWTKKDGVWYDENGIKAFKNGGVVDFTGLAWLDGSKASPERVLSSEQNKTFTTLMKSIPNIMQNVSSESKSEVYNINIEKVQTNNALGFVNNLKKLTYTKGKGA